MESISVVIKPKKRNTGHWSFNNVLDLPNIHVNRRLLQFKFAHRELNTEFRVSHFLDKGGTNLVREVGG